MAYREGSAVSTGDASVTSLTLARPTGAAAGDIIVVYVYTEDLTLTPALSPGSWTEITECNGENDNATADFETRVYWLRQESDSSDISITWGGATVWATALGAAFSGRVASGDPEEGTATYNESQVNDTVPTPLGLTTSTFDADLVAFCGNPLGVAYAWGDTMRKRLDVGGQTLGTLMQNVAGASGDKPAVISGAPWSAMMLGLKTAAATHFQATVAASADDAQQVGTTCTINGTTIGASLDATTDWAGMRWDNVTVPNGATIHTAYLACVPSGTGEDEPLVTIYAEDADDPAQFTTTASDISNRSRTSGVSWSDANLGVSGATYAISADIASQIQTVVNRAGWASGNAMVVIVQGGATSTRDLTIEAQDLGPDTNPPILAINYTAAVAGGAMLRQKRMTMLGAG